MPCGFSYQPVLNCSHTLRAEFNGIVSMIATAQVACARQLRVLDGCVMNESWLMYKLVVDES